jgi:hypothetical protein
MKANPKRARSYSTWPSVAAMLQHYNVTEETYVSIAVLNLTKTLRQATPKSEPPQNETELRHRVRFPTVALKTTLPQLAELDGELRRVVLEHKQLQSGLETILNNLRERAWKDLG